MPPAVTLEDVILNLPQAHREVVTDLRARLFDAERRTAECESELTFARQRIQELEDQVASLQNQPPPLPAPLSNLQELIALMKAQHQSHVEALRRQTTEKINQLEDTAFDAEEALQQSVARSLRPLPKNFEFVDLMQLREQFSAEGFAPSSPLQQPLISEFLSHIDGVRQCTRDARFAQLYYDPVKADLLRRMFDMCKTAEARMGSTGYLALPSLAVTVDLNAKDATEAELTGVRRREFGAHMQSIEQCGDVYARSCKEVVHLDDMTQSSSVLPHFLGEFDLVTQAMANDAENLQRNEVVLVEAGSLHIENLTSHRRDLMKQAADVSVDIEQGERAVDALFNEMFKLLTRAEAGFRDVMQLVGAHAKLQIDIALCDSRTSEIRKTVEQEVQKQQRYLEGAKFTTFLTNKSRDLYRRLYNNLDESIRSRKDLCERVKITSQEQLYTMAELLHDIVVKRQSSDLQALRNDQSALENANRSLMGLVHQPQEMDRQMESIRELTLNISQLKNRLSQSTHDIASIRSILAKNGTIQFLRRDTNFLSIYDSAEKASRVREKLDDAITRVKYVSEVLVEVSDPDTRQDYVVQQCLDALKVSVADCTDLIACREQMDSFDDAYRTATSAKLKRHKRLVAHFLEEIKEGSNDIAQQAPAMEMNVVALIEGLETITAILDGGTHEERSASAAGAAGGLQRSKSMGPRSASAAAAGAKGGHIDPATGSFAGSLGRDDGSMVLGGGHSAVEFAIGAEQVAHHTFARFSSKLKASHDLHRLSKPPGNAIEMNNTSALGAQGFRLGSGVHAFSIKIGANCSRLLVGFADWNLPLDGYCNSLKYQGCYYLHVGNGTLWAPELNMERKPYSYEAIGANVGGVLKAVIDTNNRTIGFVWNDINLGVAFKNVNLTRTLYPAFEIFSNSCTFEFFNTVEAGDANAGAGSRRL